MRAAKWKIAGACLALIVWNARGAANAQMVTGRDMPGYTETFGVANGQDKAPYSVALIESSAPGNLLYPGEQPKFTFQIVNNQDRPLVAQGKAEIIAYGTKGQPGDIWAPRVFKVGNPASVPIRVNIAAKGYADFTVAPKIPAAFGAYALVVDLGPLGRQFVTSCGRTFAASTQRIQYPKFCLDDINLDVLKRLGVQAIRHGVSYKPTSEKDFDSWYAEEGAKLKRFQDANIAVLMMVGAGDWYTPEQPLRRPRPWLSSDGVMLDTKTDIAWLPAYDADFQNYTHRFAAEYGWPKGPINAFSLWNEPWEGISISGWGADMLRYREMYRRMAAGVVEARKNDGVDLLVGGCDSTSNAIDKLFSDGSDEFSPIFDFASIHYQGLDSFATFKPWMNRKGPKGRVKIWDTESWVANTDDRVAALVAANRAAGYDRAMGVYGGNIAEDNERDIRTADGKTRRIHNVTAWSVAPAIGASQHFIGERDFDRILFQNGLPWVFLFHGLPDASGKINDEDGAAVVVGDIGEEFGADGLPFRTARGFAEKRHKAELKAQLAALPAFASEKQKMALAAAIAKPETLSGASMTLAASGSRYGLFDFYGNPVAAKSGKITIPLDGRGFFLRGNGKRGSFAQLVQALQKGRVSGIEPLAIQAHDMTARIESRPTMTLTLTNILNRAIKGNLTVTLGSLQITAPKSLQFKPNETQSIAVKITGGASVASNSYPLTVKFDAGGDGTADHAETMRVNVIAKRTITVDGNLDDWKDIPPQTVTSPEIIAPSLTEAAYFPFKTFDAGVTTGFATGYLAYDDTYFYFASKVADSSPDPGMLRFENRDDNEFFYPEKSLLADKNANGAKTELVWPEGVRRYSYRKDPELPSGNTPEHDNIQIAFNVLSEDAKPSYKAPPGVMPGFTVYKSTDYEYALNPVAEKYGGGVEIWRMETPGMPHKHFYPRQPKAPGEGPVKEGKLVILRDGTTRITECAIPWAELPDVKKRLDAGQTIKFSFRVNDNSNVGCMELARGRSVSSRGSSFHSDWLEHWANEIEFGFEK